ncbi:unnamed protein product [marine sediment metagenome]|uniref:Bacterial type II secretion system protein E domain-containing protein n=1 Tax=marine sediment metagenome TaxID=412755 RepID=X1IJW0_9ZZZZ
MRRLCEQCKRREGEGGRCAAVGCEACFGTGYRGRTLIAELVELTGELRKAVLAKADLETLAGLLKRRGHMDLRHGGAGLVTAGVTTPAELDRVCGPAEDGSE